MAFVLFQPLLLLCLVRFEDFILSIIYIWLKCVNSSKHKPYCIENISEISHGVHRFSMIFVSLSFHLTMQEPIYMFVPDLTHRPRRILHVSCLHYTANYLTILKIFLTVAITIPDILGIGLYHCGWYIALWFSDSRLITIHVKEQATTKLVSRGSPQIIKCVNTNCYCHNGSIP